MDVSNLVCVLFYVYAFVLYQLHISQSSLMDFVCLKVGALYFPEFPIHVDCSLRRLAFFVDSAAIHEFPRKLNYFLNV